MAPVFKSNFSIRAILAETQFKHQIQVQAKDHGYLQLGDQTSPKTNNKESPQFSSNGSTGNNASSGTIGKSEEVSERRPIYSFKSLITMAIQSSPKKLLTLNEICSWIEENFQFYKKRKSSWYNSVRHNLSINSCFKKVPRPTKNFGRGHYWAVDPKADDIKVEADNCRLRESNPLAGNVYSFQNFRHCGLQGHVSAGLSYPVNSIKQSTMQKWQINYDLYPQHQFVTPNGGEYFTNPSIYYSSEQVMHTRHAIREQNMINYHFYQQQQHRGPYFMYSPMGFL